MKGKILFFMLVLSVNIFAINLGNWDYYEKDEFKVYYPPKYEYYAKMVLSAILKHKEEVKEISGNTEDIETRIVIQDTGQYTNGYADNVNQKIAIFINPPKSKGLFANTGNWLRTVGVHEYTHIMQLNNSKGLAKKISNILGNQTSPNQAVPYWIVEGITVYQESAIDSQEGRMNGGYYDKIVAIKAKKDKMPSTLEANYRHDHYPMGQHYTYGGSFFKFLSEKYGREKIADFFSRNGEQWWNSIFYIGYLFPKLGIDRAAEKTFGKDFAILFKDWEKAEKDKVKDIDIDRNKIIENVSEITFYKDKIYYEKKIKQRGAPFNYREYYEIREYDVKTKKDRLIKRLKNAILNNIKIRDGELYYSLGEIGSFYENIDMNGKGIKSNLYSLNLDNLETKFISNEDFYDYDLNKDGDLYLLKREKEDYKTSIKIIKKTGEIKKYKTDYMISQIEIYKDKKYITAKDEFSSWDVKLFEKGDIKDLLTSYTHEYNIRILDNSLYFNSSYTKELGYYRYDIENEKLYDIDLGISGIFGFRFQDDFYFRGIDVDGEHLFKKEYKEKEIKDWNIKFVGKNRKNLEYPKLELKKKNSYWENYKYLLKPSTRNPFYISGQDALGINKYEVYNAIETGDDGLKVNSDLIFTTKVLNPINLSYSHFDEDIFTASLSLYQSQIRNISNVFMSINKEEKLLYSSVGLSFNFIKTQIQFVHSVEKENSGIREMLSFSKYFSRTKVNLMYLEFKDFKTTIGQNSFGTFSNYNGSKSKINVTVKALEIREGMRNPNFFIGDIYFKTFYQRDKFEIIKKHEKEYYGVGLMSEMGIAMYTNFVLDLGLIFNGDNENKIQLSLAYPY